MKRVAERQRPHATEQEGGHDRARLAVPLAAHSMSWSEVDLCRIKFRCLSTTPSHLPDPTSIHPSRATSRLLSATSHSQRDVTDEANVYSFIIVSSVRSSALASSLSSCTVTTSRRYSCAVARSPSSPLPISNLASQSQILLSSVRGAFALIPSASARRWYCPAGRDCPIEA